MTEVRSANGMTAHSEEPYQGPLGRTLRKSVTVTGRSGDTFEAMVFSQVNITESPHLRTELMEGRLTTVVDPHTDEHFALALPVLYHDEALRLFALVLPDSMRHMEFAQRTAVLSQMATAGGALPRYVREFRTVFGAQGLLQAEDECRSPQQTQGPAPENADLSRQRQQLEAQARQLAEERHELAARRFNLEGLKSRLQDKEAALRKGITPAETGRQDNEPTTVVPREVFYKSLDATSVDDNNAPESTAGWGADTDRGWELDGDSSPPPPLARTNGSPLARTSSSELPVTDSAPRTFNRLKAGSRAYYHTQNGDQILLSYRLSEERMRRFTQNDPRLFLQFHDLNEFPLITVLLAALDENENLIDDLYWPMDVRKGVDKRLLSALSNKFELRAALYGDDLKLRQVLTFKEPLEFNAQHLQSLASERLNQSQGLSYDDALRRIEAPDYERLGSMRHNFQRDSFTDLDSPARVKLAAGIVGYWSGPETFRYLIENRSFSLAWFASIQERVARAAVRFGIALAPELRQVAVELSLAEDEQKLITLLASTWAEIELGVGGRNDLDPLETWENWQDLIEAIEGLDSTLGAELAELARAALRRAQSFAEDNDLLSAFPEGDLEGDLDDLQDPPTLDASDKLDELPVAAGADFNEEELKAMLVDEEKRLDAAIKLLRHANPDAVMDVLMAAERMDDDELERLSEQLSLSAPRLEDSLLDCLALDTPTIAYLCAFALASVPSQRALPTLLNAIQDPERAPDPALFSETLLPYGHALADAAAPMLKDIEGLSGDHPLIILLNEYAQSIDADALAALKEQAPEAAPFLG